MAAVGAGIAAFVAVTVVVVAAGRDTGTPLATSADGADPLVATTYPTVIPTATSTSTYSATTPTDTSQATGSRLSAGSVPSGYRRISGPAGIEVTIPEDWPVKTGSIPSNDQADAPDGSGTFLRYGGTPTPSMALQDAVAQNEVTNTGIRAGYQRLRLDSVPNGGTETVVWEFLFTKSGQQRHALGWFWRANGYDYVAYASAADSRWNQLQPVLDVFTQTAGPR
ncbi:hypothetical protein [Amycolatopsis australiensis]|uniref:Alanine and proline-rich secreted protein Apa n=1 Tax=Amycolatopsis australiensis TaxID=546364 RepID=A0A1K1T6C6_9PSEU|nr:hypothetical protein [Amycolatopsis australiensis]SFW92122.1 hypothetical protein SAMN04489730_8399 [Amycolatopsis australiensis]